MLRYCEVCGKELSPKTKGNLCRKHAQSAPWIGFFAKDDIIKRMYINEGQTLDAVAKYLNASRRTISRHLSHMGVKLHHNIRPLSITMPTSVADLAYLAGLMDGEGSFIVVKDKEKLRPVVSLGITSEEAINHLSTIGGSVSFFPKRKGKRKPYWSWALTRARDVLLFTESLRPYLVIKAEAADKVIDACKAILE